MASNSYQKTWSLPPAERNPRSGESGSMTLLVVFIFFLFSALGIGLICISDVHTKFSRHRRDVVLLSFAAENGVKGGYSVLATAIASGSGPKTCSEALYHELRLDGQNGGIRTLEQVMEKPLPLDLQGDDGGSSWTVELSFDTGAPILKESYFVAECSGHVRSNGRLAGKIPAKRATLDVSATIVAGYIPLAGFPLLVAADLTSEERRQVAENRDIVILPSRRSVTFPRTGFAPAAAIPRDADPLVKKALKIKIFSPEKLTRAEIRSALGLEMVNEPVPDGVYLIENDTGLGGLFIQGDVDEMILAIEADFQVISIRRGTESLELEIFPLPPRNIVFDAGRNAPF